MSLAVPKTTIKRDGGLTAIGSGMPTTKSGYWKKVDISKYGRNHVTFDIYAASRTAWGFSSLFEVIIPIDNRLSYKFAQPWVYNDLISSF